MSTARLSGDAAAPVRVLALDGLRGIAVLAVLAYHAGVPGFGGGLLGVDMFFVLSGYLITSLLVGEWERTGTVALGRFWGRRARRLLPALIVLSAGIAAYAAFFVGPDALHKLRADSLSTLFYVANWHFVLSAQDYFVQNGPPSPLLHTWSLAVEEQFYLVWPVVALLVLRWRGTKALAWVAGVGAAVSAGLMGALYLMGTNVSRLYYGTDTRAQALLVGGLLACLVAARRQSAPGRSVPWRAALSWAALPAGAFVVWALHGLAGQAPFLYQGGFLLVAVSVAVVMGAVASTSGGPVASAGGRLLAAPWLRWCGRVSYGLYVYHYPLFLVLDHQHTGLAGVPLLAARMASTFAVAAVSYQLWEQPIRAGTWFASRRALVAAPLAMLTAVGGLVAATVVPAAAAAAPARVAPAGVAPTRVASAGVASAAPLGAVAYSAQPVKAMLLGDSMAITLGNGLGVDSTNWGVSLMGGATIGCDLDPQLTVQTKDVVSPAAQGCPDWRQHWAGLVQQSNPDVVALLLGRWEVSDRIFDGHWTHIGNRDWDSHLQAELVQAIDILSARGAKVVLYTLPYIQGADEQPNGLPWAINTPARTDAYNAVLRRAAGERPSTATLVDLNHLLDPQGHYTAYIDGVRTRFADEEHITDAGGELLRPALLPELARAGRLHQGAVVASSEAASAQPAPAGRP